MIGQVSSYSASYHFIQDGDIVFIRNYGTRVHRIISYFTQSDHIHVGIAFWAYVGEERMLMISEANGGVKRRIINLSHYKHHEMDVLCSKHEWNSISHRVLSQIGHVQYGWTKAMYVGMREFFGYKFRRTLPMLNLSGEICSEFVATVLELEETFLSPAKLYNYMRTQLEYQPRVHIRKGGLTTPYY